MPFRNFKNRFRKDVMTRNGFLAYRQGLILTAPGSGKKSAAAGWRALPDSVGRLRSGVRRIAQSTDMAFRELVLSNTLLILYMAYAVRGRYAPAVAGTIVRLRHSTGAVLKRSIDLLGVGLGLLILSPLLAVIALAIKLDSEGPVFFTQMRIGLNRRRSCSRDSAAELISDRRRRDRRRNDLYGKPFMVYKFRSMVNNAEKKSGPIWATENDPRITRVGGFLRKTRLDEVPQLFNVLRGEMSLVGPRPERPVFVASLSRDIADYQKRLSVKPGITGLAQVITGYDTSISSVRAKVRQDLSYIDNWTVVQDLKIMMKTVIVVITGKGAF